MSPTDVLEAVRKELRSGRWTALCAVVATRGSTPQPPGALLSVDEAAGMTGTIGGGCVEAEVRRAAFHLLQRRRSGLLTFRLDHDDGYDDGMICGGELDVAVRVLDPRRDRDVIERAASDLRSGRETVLTFTVSASDDAGDGEKIDGSERTCSIRLEPPPTLLIAGAGHISRVLAGFALPLGFRVCVADDRPDFANADRFPPPMRPVVGDIEETLRGFPIDASTYV
ncbi:MAG: hypothetical protein D6788_08575, partial [Planctomycetota bacterium]